MSGVFIHNQALCESDDVGPGTRIWAFAHVMAGSTIGSNCNVCDNVFVESGAVIGNGVILKNNVSVWEGVTLEDDVFVGPSVVFTNDRVPRANPAFKATPEDFSPIRVGRGASIGANATLVAGVTVGDHAFIAAGSVVTHDVPDHGLVMGVPGRLMAWVCECGRRLDEPLLQCGCGRRYEAAANGLRRTPGSGR